MPSSWILKSAGKMAWTFAATFVDRKSTRLNSSHLVISYAVFCLKKKNVNLTYLRGCGGGPLWRVWPQRLWDDFSAHGALGPYRPGKDNAVSLRLTREHRRRQRA